MKLKALIAIAITGALAPLAMADAAKAPVLTVREVAVDKSFPTGKDADFTLRCPRGWKATGFGYGAGGMDLFYADTDGSGRGYSFLANSPTYSDGSPIEAPPDGWGLQATVICARGAGSLRVNHASIALAEQRKAAAKAQHEAATP